MHRLIQLIGKCQDWRSLYAISEQFLENGLALERTLSNRMILCRVQDGIPQHSEIFDDYIFACGLSEDERMTPEAKAAIIDFVSHYATDPQEIRPLPSYRRNHALYGQIMVHNEERAIAKQQIDLISRTIID